MAEKSELRDDSDEMRARLGVARAILEVLDRGAHDTVSLLKAVSNIRGSVATEQFFEKAVAELTMSEHIHQRDGLWVVTGKDGLIRFRNCVEWEGDYVAWGFPGI